ncbi:TlpA family protein disulfide reductase [Campylobacter canadensis]|uniref:TlpA family protein disulfide reductase n=1 Tax=Campylobacter canadensis TaxID=449520 RepID=UPI001CCA5CAB|nr:TlpA disulfide reductase family protein [Campylobacter canadensis]MBZ7994984.1 TlpA family protein disulfide reductase [Campylobacter canadensis]
MKKIFLIFVLLFCACSEEKMSALNSKELIMIKFDAKQKAIKGINEAFMLFFYTQDCGVCNEQIPVLNELNKENKIKLIAVLGGARDYLDAKKKLKGVEFATIYDPNDVEYLSSIVGGIYGVPAMFIYDKEGKLKKRFLSLTPKSVLLKEINLLNS